MSVSFPGCKPGLPKPAASLTACVRVFAFGVIEMNLMNLLVNSIELAAVEAESRRRILEKQ
jgi:hypothetical protein